VGSSSASNVAKVDTGAPANSLSLSNVSPAGSAYKSGTTVYYNGNASGGGSFKLSNAVSDSESGPASSATAALGGTSAGWSHTASTVSTPAGGPYVSNAFSWAQGTSSSPTETVTGADAAGNTAQSTLTFTNDEYVSNAFSWAQGTSSSPTETVTGADAAGNTAQSTLTFTNDVTGPSVTASSVTGGYYNTTSVPVTANGGSDSGSGLAAGSSQI